MHQMNDELLVAEKKEKHMHFDLVCLCVAVDDLFYILHLYTILRYYMMYINVDIEESNHSNAVSYNILCTLVVFSTNKLCR